VFWPGCESIHGQWQGQGSNTLLSCHCATNSACTHGLDDLQARHKQSNVADLSSLLDIRARTCHTASTAQHALQQPIWQLLLTRQHKCVAAT
jgi:hypothetical protein